LKNVHLCPFMLQYGWYVDNSNGEKTHEHEMGAYSKWSCVRVQLHNWKNAYSKWAGWIIYIYLPMFQAYAVAEQLVLKCLPMLLLPVPSASEGTSHKTQNDPNIFNFQNGVKTTKQLSQAKIRFPWEILSNRSCGRSRARACFKLRIHQGHTHTKKNPPTPANSRGSASEEKCRLRGITTRGVFRRATFLEGSKSIKK
jgi:hypothetical protein